MTCLARKPTISPDKCTRLFMGTISSFFLVWTLALQGNSAKFSKHSVHFNDSLPYNFSLCFFFLFLSKNYKIMIRKLGKIHYRFVNKINNSPTRVVELATNQDLPPVILAPLNLQMNGRRHERIYRSNKRL